MFNRWPIAMWFPVIIINIPIVQVYFQCVEWCNDIISGNEHHGVQRSVMCTVSCVLVENMIHLGRNSIATYNVICKIHLGFDEGFFCLICLVVIIWHALINGIWLQIPSLGKKISINQCHGVRFIDQITSKCWDSFVPYAQSVHSLYEYLLYGFIVTIQWCFYRSFFCVFLLYSNGHSLPFDYTIYWRFKTCRFFIFLS